MTIPGTHGGNAPERQNSRSARPISLKNGESERLGILTTSTIKNFTLSSRKFTHSSRLSTTSKRRLPQHNLSKFLLLFSIVHLTYSSRTIFGQLVSGEAASCENEGESIQVELLKDKPCFQCVCKDRKVQCRINCEKNLPCFAPVNMRGECCPVCQKCYHKRKSFSTSVGWERGERKNACERLFCRDGILTRAKRQCFVPCKNPLPASPGECCPSCQGCLFEGKLYKEGETLMLDDHRACTTCTCKKGSISCLRDPCPILACRREDERISDGCCQKCAGRKNFPDIPAGHCHSEQGILQPGERVTVDECTKCKCKNGTLVCDTQTCPITLRCSLSDWMLRPGECCPMCLEDVPNKCVDSKGKKRKHGVSWTEGRNSCTDCTCTNATITCQPNYCESAPTTCSKGKTLELIPRHCCKTCVEEPGICSVFGDPHYRTFDGKPFNFQGDCRYLIAKDCKNMNFSIEVQNDAKTSSSFSWTKAVYMTIMTRDSKDGTKLSLHQHLLTKVNGRKVSFPYISRNLVITKERSIVKVRTKIGVSLSWDGDSFLEIGASSAYKGQLCGLCGNYNGFSRDDFIGGDGSFKPDEVSFAESWKSDNGQCTRRDYSPGPEESCGRNVMRKLAARKSCSLFKSPQFKVCYDKVDPMDYYNSCVTDTCECPADRQCSCESILAYTSACARKGALINWDKPTHCEKKCKRGKVYSRCGPACKRTCKNHKRLRGRACAQECQAGCHCPAGSAIHLKKCIRISQCEKALRTAKRTVRNQLSRFQRKRTRFVAKRDVLEELNSRLDNRMGR